MLCQVFYLGIHYLTPPHFTPRRIKKKKFAIIVFVCYL